MYDAIVVGAGPAGSIAATILAKNGRQVLLLDRAQFPRDKTCGDAIGSNSINLLSDLGLSLAQVTHNLYYCDKVRATSPTGYVFEGFLPEKRGYASHRYIISRRDLDHILYSFALQQGAEFECLHVIEPITERGMVCGVRGKTDNKTVEHRGKIVIAADGANSVIARCLGISRSNPRQTGVAMRAYVGGVQNLDHCMDFYFFGFGRLRGYGWIFPLGKGIANVGVGVRLDVLKKSRIPLRQVFEQFRQDPVIERRLSGATSVGKATGQVTPFASQRLRRAYSGALLVGDAGAFVSPLTGAGIYNALLTGQIAAEVALEAIEENDTTLEKLQMFEARWRHALGSRLGAEAIMQELFHWPGILDRLIRQMSKNRWLANIVLNRV